MVSRERVVSFVRNYLALFVLVIGSLQLIEIAFRVFTFWESVIAIVILVVVYGQLLRRIGWEPLQS